MFNSLLEDDVLGIGATVKTEATYAVWALLEKISYLYASWGS